MKSCKNCIFFMRKGGQLTSRQIDDGFGTCRRYPPRTLIQLDAFYSVCPKVFENDFCGEHKSGGKK